MNTKKFNVVIAEANVDKDQKPTARVTRSASITEVISAPTRQLRSNKPQVVYHLGHQAGDVTTDSDRSGLLDFYLYASSSALAAAVLTPTAPPLTSGIVAQTLAETKLTQSSAVVPASQPVAVAASDSVTQVPPPRYKPTQSPISLRGECSLAEIP